MLIRAVYSAKKTALADNVGRRLENFFWRIWSSEKIRDRISGTQVAVQFSSINEGGYIRTTPTPSPRSSRSLKSYYKAARSASPPQNAPSTPPPVPPTAYEPSSSGDEFEGSSVTPTTTSPLTAVTKKSSAPRENRRTTTTTTTRPPPILKKSSSGSSDSSKTSTHSSIQIGDAQSGKGADDEEAVNLDEGLAVADRVIPIIRHTGPNRRSTTTRFNEEVAVSIPKFSTSAPRAIGVKPRRSSGDSTSSQRSGKRIPVVVASAGTSRRRPAVLPRRSSGTASLGSSRNPSYSKLARSPKSTAIDPTFASSREQETQSTRRARAASPHPSKQRRRLSPGRPSDKEDSGVEETQAQSGVSRVTSEASEDATEGSEDDKSEPDKPLVDPNFRSKFVDRTRSPQRSFTNLPAFARKSSAAVATAASFQATGTIGSGQPTSSAGRGKGREAFTNVTAPLKAPAAAGPEVTGDEAARPLPKTKSQLTLLLEREKARSSG